MGKRSKRDKTDTIDIKFVDDFSEGLLVETFKLMDVRGPVVGQQIALSLLAKFIGVYVHQALSDSPSHLITQREKYEHASACFKQAKEDVTQAVAFGVGGAMKAFSGKDVEYYCLLKTMPEPINKLPS